MHGRVRQSWLRVAVSFLGGGNPRSTRICRVYLLLSAAVCFGSVRRWMKTKRSSRGRKHVCHRSEAYTLTFHRSRIMVRHLCKKLAVLTREERPRAGLRAQKLRATRDTISTVLRRSLHILAEHEVSLSYFLSPAWWQSGGPEQLGTHQAHRTSHVRQYCRTHPDERGL